MDVLHPQLRSHREAGRSLPVLVWRASEPVLAISSAPHGGGIGPRRWFVNAQVPASYSRRDPDAHLRKLGVSCGLPGRGVGMLTAADVREVQHAVDDGVAAAATVGIAQPTWAAAPDVAGPVPVVGTINLLAWVPERLSEAALVNTIGTVTEAKAQALWDLGVAATGTVTDAVVVVCPAEGRPAAFGGPRSVWGSRLARAVHAAVVAGGR